MNEEEIIKDLTKYISFANKSENFSNDNDFKWNTELSQRVQSLLDLYQKEKEKNKKLEKINFRVNNNLLELAEKIENKIMELEEDLRENNYADKTTNAIKYAIKVLQELLEERN